MTTEQEIIQLREQLATARNIISEVKDYLENGGYLGQREGLIWECKEFLKENDHSEAPHQEQEYYLSKEDYEMIYGWGGQG